MNLATLNSLSEEQAREELFRCCYSKRWVAVVASKRPFQTFDALLKNAEQGFDELEPEDWLEAFSGHPKIGDMQNLRSRFANTGGWSAVEQSGVKDAQEAVLEALAQGNKDYEKKFGYIFIVCATGKTAAEMLDILQSRIGNDPAEELKLAANEQRKITKIRLEKLCQEVPSQPTC